MDRANQELSIHVSNFFPLLIFQVLLKKQKHKLKKWASQGALAVKLLIKCQRQKELRFSESKH